VKIADHEGVPECKRRASLEVSLQFASFFQWSLVRAMKTSENESFCAKPEMKTQTKSMSATGRTKCKNCVINMYLQ
jgi:hypothetical protein